MNFTANDINKNSFINNPKTLMQGMIKLVDTIFCYGKIRIGMASQIEKYIDARFITKKGLFGYHFQKTLLVLIVKKYIHQLIDFYLFKFYIKNFFRRFFLI